MVQGIAIGIHKKTDHERGKIEKMEDTEVDISERNKPRSFNRAPCVMLYLYDHMAMATDKKVLRDLWNCPPVKV